MKSKSLMLMLALLLFAGAIRAQEAGHDPSHDKAWRERLVGGWRFEHRSVTKEGVEQLERTEIRFGRDGTYRAATAITTPVEAIKLPSSGTFEVMAIDADRARLRLVHASKDPSVPKDELTEIVEVSAKGRTTLVFPGNAVLTSIP